MEINLNYVHDPSMGYGRLGVKLAAALQRRGVTVYDDLPRPVAVKSIDVAALDKPHDNALSGIADVACWVSVPTHATGWWSNQRPVIFTMWEATYLPESFRETLDDFDLVIVPSLQNLELFGQFHSNVKYVPLGVDPDEWHLIDRPEPEVYFDFLCGGSGPRKGTDLAYRAFLEAFPEESLSPDLPIPRLILKNPKREKFDDHNGRVVVIGDSLEADEEIDLYARSHCYVQPSRGEGFGLQPLQAIAQGMPTILTNAHGHAAFAELGIPISAELQPAAYFIYGDAKDWWEPDFDELVGAMRRVYENYGLEVERAKTSAAVVAESFTWDAVAGAFLDAVQPGSDLADPGEWFEPEYKVYRLRVLKDWKCEIAGRRYIFVAGEDYWVRADVKRIIAETGMLDPECVDDDSGLTQEQAQQVVGNPKHLYCPHCEVRIGTGLTRADEIEMEMEAEAIAFQDAQQGDSDLTAWHAGV